MRLSRRWLSRRNLANVDDARTVCPICGTYDSFVALSEWSRDDLTCTGCHNGSVPRERAVALALRDYAPEWRMQRILECSPAPRGISVELMRKARHYQAINLFPDRPLGAVVNSVRNEDLEAMSFADSSFDVFVSLDVLEHVPHPETAVREISRVVTPNGFAFLTFPIRKHQVEPVIARAFISDDGTLDHLAEPEWHGNPFSSDGSLVFTDFGYDVHQWLFEASGRNATVIRFADAQHGIVGELTDVCVLGPLVGAR